MGSFTAFSICSNWKFICFNTAHGIGFPCSSQITAACSPKHGITRQGHLQNGLLKKLFSCCPHTQTQIFIASRQKKNGWTLSEVLGFAATNLPGASLLSSFCLLIHLLLHPSLSCPRSHSLYLIVLLFSSSEVGWGSCNRVCGCAVFVLTHARRSMLHSHVLGYPCLRLNKSHVFNCTLLSSAFTSNFTFLHPFWKFSTSSEDTL